MANTKTTEGKRMPRETGDVRCRAGKPEMEVLYHLKYGESGIETILSPFWAWRPTIEY